MGKVNKHEKAAISAILRQTHKWDRASLVGQLIKNFLVISELKREVRRARRSEAEACCAETRATTRANTLGKKLWQNEQSTTGVLEEYRKVLEQVSDLPEEKQTMDCKGCQASMFLAEYMLRR